MRWKRNQYSRRRRRIIENPNVFQNVHFSRTLMKRETRSETSEGEGICRLAFDDPFDPLWAIFVSNKSISDKGKKFKFKYSPDNVWTTRSNDVARVAEVNHSRSSCSKIIIETTENDARGRKIYFPTVFLSFRFVQTFSKKKKKKNTRRSTVRDGTTRCPVRNTRLRFRRNNIHRTSTYVRRNVRGPP